MGDKGSIPLLGNFDDHINLCHLPVQAERHFDMNKSSRHTVTRGIGAQTIEHI